MIIKGIGIDNADIKRFKNKDKLAKRILSSSELEEYYLRKDKASFLASRFALKEAYYKASNDKSTSYDLIEVRKQDNGKPILFVNNKEISALISLTHDKIASAIIIIYE